VERPRKEKEGEQGEVPIPAYGAARQCGISVLKGPGKGRLKTPEVI
jgi:hypothetical protein